MKAWKLTKYGDFEKGLKLTDAQKPVPADDEVLLKVHSAAINPVDYKIAEGQLRLIYNQSLPAGLAFDCSGTIESSGKNVSHLKVGDDVFCCTPTDSPGVIQEHVCVKAKLVAAIPYNMNMPEAASMPMVGLTTLSCLEAIELKPGEKILIHAGSGGVGSFAVQYASKLGAEVYTTTSTTNVDWVKQLGAEKVIDYTSQKYMEEVSELDVVFDTLGGKFTTEAFELLKPGGRVVSIAGRRLDETTARQYGLNWFFRMIMKWQMRPIKKLCKKHKATYKFILNEPDGERLKRLKNAIEEGNTQAVINKQYPFLAVKEAFEMQQSGRSKGKNVISIG